MVHCRARVRFRWLLGVLAGLVCVSAHRAPAEVHADARGKKAAARQAAPVTDSSVESALVDFTRGLIIARGEAAADLRAPSPEVARVKAERQARERAVRRLGERARALLQAEASPAGSQLDAIHERALERAMARVIDLELEYASDGSVVLHAGLPLEALRGALSGVPAYAPVEPGNEPDGGTLYQSVVVDARGVLAHPVLHAHIATANGPLAGPTIYHRSVESGLADPRAGTHVLVVRAGTASLAAEPGEPARTSLRRALVQLDPARDATRAYRRGRGTPDKAGQSGKSGLEPASIDQVAPALARGALVIIVIGEKP